MANILKSSTFEDYLILCKPKVIIVMLVTTWVGMHLATHSFVPLNILIFGTIGIAFAGGAAAVINHLLDRHIDAQMSRTENRPLVCKRISIHQAILFALILGSLGLLILNIFVNPLTALLTLMTVLGYAVLYTLFLKRRTPQNIVIGGAAGAMPPLLGWTAVTDEINALAWLPVLIIFTWTPPHFWALAIYRIKEYQKANIPMLPVTHGVAFTKLSMILYTILLFVISLLPYATQMSGLVYLSAAILLGIAFLIQMLILYRSESIAAALKTFSFSIVYLLLLFIFLLVDHYVPL